MYGLAIPSLNSLQVISQRLQPTQRADSWSRTPLASMRMGVLVSVVSAFSDSTPLNRPDPNTAAPATPMLITKLRLVSRPLWISATISPPSGSRFSCSAITLRSLRSLTSCFLVGEASVSPRPRCPCGQPVWARLLLPRRSTAAHIQKAPDWTLSCAPFTEWKASRFPLGTLTVLLPWLRALGGQDSEA